MNIKRMSEILEEIEERRVPSNVDLLPQILHQVEMQKIYSERLPNASLFKKNGFFLVVLFIMVLSVFLMAVPEVRARTAQFIQRFGVVLIGSEPVDNVSSSSTPASEQPTVIEQELHKISLEEAQALVPFPIPTLNLVPDGLTLSGAMVGPGPSGTSCDRDGNCTTTGSTLEVDLFYMGKSTSQENADANIQLTIYQGNPAGGYSAPQSEEEIVFINGNEAVYVKGAWKEFEFPESEDEKSFSESLEWDNTVDAGFLSWTDDEFAYVLSFYKLGLDKAALVRIAESVSK